MQTFFIEPDNIIEEKICPTGDLCHHLTRVLRVRVGEQLRFSDNESWYYDATAEEVGKNAVTFAVNRRYPIDDEPRYEVTLIQCLPRGDKTEQVLQKCTELGASRFILAESENSQIRLKPDKKVEKQQRWQKVVASAAEQCGRGRIPVVLPPQKLIDAVAEAAKDSDLLFCYEHETNRSFRETVQSFTKNKITVIIGPEGGFSPQEAEAIRKLDGHSVTMGKRILRAETAGPTALAVLLFELGEWEVKV